MSTSTKPPRALFADPIFEEITEIVEAGAAAEDDHFYGPWTTGGGRGAPTSPAGVRSVAKRGRAKKPNPYASQARPGSLWNPPPALRATAPEAKKWREAVKVRYDSDPEFRAAVDAASLYAQGDFSFIKAGVKNEIPETWVMYKPREQQVLAAPLTVTTNPMADYKNYMTGKVEKGISGKDAFAGTPLSLRDSAVAFDRAVDNASRSETPIYRGIRGYWRPNDAALANNKILQQIDDRMFMDAEFKAKLYSMYPEVKQSVWTDREVARRYAVEHAGYLDSLGMEYNDPKYKALQGYVPGVPIPAIGETFKVDAPASFTHKFETAEKFALGRDGGQGRRGDEPPYSVIIEAKNARSLNIGALSPWMQSEAVTKGMFKVSAVQRQRWVGYDASGKWVGEFQWQDLKPFEFSRTAVNRERLGASPMIKIVMEAAD